MQYGAIPFQKLQKTPKTLTYIKNNSSIKSIIYKITFNYFNLFQNKA